jgi:hypothetical protein
MWVYFMHPFFCHSMTAKPNSTPEDTQTDGAKVKGTIMITLAFMTDPSPKQDEVCVMLHNGIDPPLILEVRSIEELTPQYLLEQAIAYQEQLPVLRLDHSTQSIKARSKLQPVQSGIKPTAQPATPPAATRRNLF